MDVSEKVKLVMKKLVGPWKKAVPVSGGNFVLCACYVQRPLNINSPQGLDISPTPVEMKAFTIDGPTAGWIGKCEKCETLYWRLNGRIF